jgi:thiamine pyrophosphate-dependent acetolactate synthase large subunit-like protein
MSKKITGGEVVVSMLAAFGVRHVFGVPGGQTLAITDAILAHPDIEFVTARHEGAAAVMADAYGRITGTPGVCIATTGPGATNLITGVGGALRDSSPAFIITCNNNAENIHKDDAQNADHVELFKPLTKWSRLIAHGSSIVQAMEEGYVRALSGNPGPVHFDFARDTIEGIVDPAPVIPAEHRARRWVHQRPRPDEACLAAVVAQVAAADRPVLWLGNGCKISGAGEVALAMAEELNIPIVTTFNGIGAVPTTHPLVFGPLSRMGTSLSTRVVAESDLVLAVGNSLNAVSTGRWKLELPEIIHIDVDPGTIGRYYGGRTTGLVGDAAASLDGIRVALGEQAEQLKLSRQSWIASLDEARTAWRQAPLDNVPVGHDMSPADLVRRMREVAPDDTLLIPDAGNPGVWSFLWEIRQPGTYIKPVGFGNMGFALPAAIASAADNPDRPVLALIGDGSLGMTLAELETLVRVGGRVVVIVMNDAGYGNIRQEQILHYDNRTIGVDFGPANYAQVAQGLGLTAERVTDLDELAKKVEAAFAGNTPVLFDVPISKDISAWTYPVFAPFEPEMD